LSISVTLGEEIDEILHLRRIFLGKAANLFEKLISGCGHDVLVPSF
jgi:hypothetical protein